MKSLKNFKEYVKEGVDGGNVLPFSLNNDRVKTYRWVSNGVDKEFKYSIGYDVFRNVYSATLLGGEFSNVYGEGKTEESAVESLKLRLVQLRNKK